MSPAKVHFSLDRERGLYLSVHQSALGYRWAVSRARALTYPDGSSYFVIGELVRSGHRRTFRQAVRRGRQFRNAQPARFHAPAA